MGYAIFKVIAPPPLPTDDKLRSTPYKWGIFYQFTYFPISILNFRSIYFRS